MPCRDGGPTPNAELEYRKYLRQKEFNKSIACAALTFIENHDIVDLFLRQINYKEQGFTSQELIDWWRDHKEEDRKRRIKEKENIKKLEQKAKQYQEKQKILNKLSPEERKILGL